MFAFRSRGLCSSYGGWRCATSLYFTRNITKSTSNNRSPKELYEDAHLEQLQMRQDMIRLIGGMTRDMVRLDERCKSLREKARQNDKTRWGLYFGDDVRQVQEVLDNFTKSWEKFNEKNDNYMQIEKVIPQLRANAFEWVWGTAKHERDLISFERQQYIDKLLESRFAEGKVTGKLEFSEKENLELKEQVMMYKDIERKLEEEILQLREHLKVQNEKELQLSQSLQDEMNRREEMEKENQELKTQVIVLKGFALFGIRVVHTNSVVM